MSIFSACVYKIIPLYAFVLLGYIAGKVLGANRDTVARIMLFLIAPLVILNGAMHAPIEASTLSLPILVASMSSFICLIFYAIGKKVWNDSTKSLIAYSAGTANTGYFGLPIALLLFDDAGEGVYIMTILGITLFENTLGYYLFARETKGVKECLLNLLKLPTIYAFVIGLLYNYLKIPVHPIFDEFIVDIKGAYTVLGMMVIGLGLSSLTQFKFDYKYIALSFMARFLVWPLLIFAVISIDHLFIHAFNNQIRNSLILLSIVPIGSNTVVMAQIMNSYTEKAATAVALSILFALFFVPFMVENFMTICG